VLNIEPATSTLADLVVGVDEDKLAAPTPCSETALGDLLDHVNTFARVFTAAGTKTKLDSGGQAGTPDASNLGPDWRIRIPSLVKALGEAWTPRSAWEGMTEAGDSDLPAEIAGVIALDEVIVHGWDLAVATGQPYICDSDLIQAAYGFVQSTVAQNPHGSPGLFGPPVSVAEGAPLLDRLIGLTGRDPDWRP
jgi:uncharacterized protein (TIGR03086 family)